jgi:hypothetical protein
MMAAQVGVGLVGSYLHLAADLSSPTVALWDRVLYGAPPFAPLLFADLAILAVLGLWGVASARAGTAPA